MVLEQVYLSSDVYMACLQLALSTEKEEVICLLLGETEKDGEKETAYIYDLKIPHRLDKKKDRVEISIEQLVAAGGYAEKLSQKLNKEIRVLGWFHSHPHITVWPSHVDVNTQANYQTMSSSFVGIIGSVFSEDKTTKENEVNLTCFQSEQMNEDWKPIPLFVVPSPPSPTSFVRCLKTISDLPEILYQEEKESFSECSGADTDILSRVHNETLLMKSVLHITNKISVPLIKSLETREKILKQQISYLEKYSDCLQSAFGGCQEESD